MGKKGGSSYHERPLSEEEKQLLRQQQAYLASIQPSIDQLVSRGTALLDDVVNPNWSSIYSQTVNDVDNLRKEQAELATGKLPDAYANAKTNYFNRIYENTMGQQLSAMARKGIVDSSRLNSATNDMQKYRRSNVEGLQRRPQHAKRVVGPKISICTQSFGTGSQGKYVLICKSSTIFTIGSRSKQIKHRRYSGNWSAE